MKTVFLLTSLIITSHLSFAQRNKERTFFPWDSLYYKNEISLDVSPVIVGLLASNIGETESFGITYKRFFSKRSTLRVGYRLTSVINSYERIQHLGYQVLTGDSILLKTTEANVSELSRWQTLRAGLEHRFGKRRLKFVLGFDLLLGIEKWEVNERNEIYTAKQHIDSSGIEQNLTPKYEYLSMTDYTYNALSFVVGITPVVGLNIDLTKRWSLNGSLIIDLAGYFPFRFSDSYAETEHQRGFTAVGGAFFPDFSVSFRF